MNWTTPADIVEQVERLWASGRLLGAAVSGEALFPRRLSLKKPDRKAMAERFGEVRGWIQTLENASKAQRSFGYDIVWDEINHRQLGRNRVPAWVIIPTERDALRLIAKDKAAERFRQLAQATLTQFPELRDWLARRPLTALDHAEDWARLMSVVSWFRDHPRSGLYLRQIDIPGVDTKFIEKRKGLLSELIGLAMDAESGIEPSATAGNFELRHGLLAKPALVRFRVLDPLLAIAGVTDLSVPISEFSGLNISPTRIFVTENEINGLAFPATPGGIVIFGLGYSVDLLSGVRWLRDPPVYYWGDIDTHGFAMLNRLRAAVPDAQSLLMDRSTLETHRSLWGVELSQFSGDLPCLSDDESALYDDLRFDRLGRRVRLEQERVPYNWVKAALSRIA